MEENWRLRGPEYVARVSKPKPDVVITPFETVACEAISINGSLEMVLQISLPICVLVESLLV